MSKQMMMGGVGGILIGIVVGLLIPTGATKTTASSGDPPIPLIAIGEPVSKSKSSFMSHADEVRDRIFRVGIEKFGSKKPEESGNTIVLKRDDAEMTIERKFEGEQLDKVRYEVKILGKHEDRPYFLIDAVTTAAGGYYPMLGSYKSQINQNGIWKITSTAPPFGSWETSMYLEVADDYVIATYYFGKPD